MPNILRLITLLSVFTLISCKSDKHQPIVKPKSNYQKINGKTMGTTYNITFKPSQTIIKQTSIDSILIVLNNSLSTYIDTSTISKINNSSQFGEQVEILENAQLKSLTKIVLPLDEHFLINYNMAEEVFHSTNGYFDPTVMPLVNYWGFGTTPKKAVTQIDSQKVESILKVVGMEKVNLEKEDNSMSLLKNAKLQLDFSGLAKGYGVDVLAKYFDSKNIAHYMVEIGGEVFTKGYSPSGEKWTIGLSQPQIGAKSHQFAERIQLDNKGLASSGNYRNFHLVNGQYYGHEINPKTGFPEINDLLGVSVTAPTTMEADAVATALMIMGLEASVEYIDKYQHLEALFFSSNDSGEILKTYSSGFKNVTDQTTF